MQFEKYKLTPEFKLRNHDMTVDGLQVDLLVGVLPPPARPRSSASPSSCPSLWFWARGRLDRPLAWKLAGIFVLGGLQGAMGWYMVKSGLVDDPRVSQFRLTAHLGLALLIFAAMFWVAHGILRPARSGAPARPCGGAGLAFAALVFAMALTGGLVAGIRAGFAYNTWPLMNGHWVPPEILMIEPWWMNFGYNMATVQFVHRTLALVVLACAVAPRLARLRLARR